jgi:hypothetical protein
MRAVTAKLAPVHSILAACPPTVAPAHPEPIPIPSTIPALS